MKTSNDKLTDNFQVHLNNIGNFLPHFIDSVPNAANIKDAHTGKYVLCNSHAIEALKLSSANSLIGQTVDDIYSNHGIYSKNLDSCVINWRNKEPDNLKTSEVQARSMNRPLSLKRIYFTIDSLIRFENMIKVPIPNRTNRTIIAIMTFSQNCISELTLNELFRLYCAFFTKRKAVHQWLKHLELNTYFDLSDLPTCTEIQVLLAMCNDTRYKVVARQHRCSVATAGNHIDHLRQKILNPFTLHDIIFKLRTMPVGLKPAQSISPLQ